MTQWVLVSEGPLSEGILGPRGSVSEAVPDSEASWVPSTGGNGSGAHHLPGPPAAAAPALLPAGAVILLLSLLMVVLGSLTPPTPPPPGGRWEQLGSSTGRPPCRHLDLPHDRHGPRPGGLPSAGCPALFSSALPFLGEQVTGCVVTGPGSLRDHHPHDQGRAGPGRVRGQGSAPPGVQGEPCLPSCRSTNMWP